MMMIDGVSGYRVRLVNTMRLSQELIGVQILRDFKIHPREMLAIAPQDAPTLLFNRTKAHSTDYLKLEAAVGVGK
jgi:hypothetical protein